MKTANIPPPHEPNAIDSPAVAAGEREGRREGEDAKSVLNDSAKREWKGNGQWEEEEDKRLSPTLPTATGGD